jgi:hypothetical protein
MVELVEVTGFTCRYCGSVIPSGELSKHEERCKKAHDKHADMRSGNYGPGITRQPTKNDMVGFSANMSVEIFTRAKKYRVKYTSFSKLASAAIADAFMTGEATVPLDVETSSVKRVCGIYLPVQVVRRIDAIHDDRSAFLRRTISRFLDKLEGKP